MRLFLYTCAALGLMGLAACSGSGLADRNANRSEHARMPSDGVVPGNHAASPSAQVEPQTSAGRSGQGDSEEETTGGDGSSIRLMRLQSGDVSGLEGELGCAFRWEKQADTILLARADVGKDARAQAVVRNNDYPEHLVSRAAGGFGALERGTSFGGRGLTVDVTSQERVATGTEEVRQHATLIVQRADGAERRYQGLWNCGP